MGDAQSGEIIELVKDIDEETLRLLLALLLHIIKKMNLGGFITKLN